VESGIPYAPLAEAFVPLLRGMSPDEVANLTRGAEIELAQLLPSIRSPTSTAFRDIEPAAELRIRLLWNFSEFLERLAVKRPLLLILDDLQWADASSLELLHFVARRIAGHRIALLCAYNDGLALENPQLESLERSLKILPGASVHRVGALTREETAALIRQRFEVGESVTRSFAELVHGWTQGNPYFLEETLKTLVDSGRLHHREGTWTGWDLDELALPGSVRESVRARLSVLTSPARGVADLLCVVGTSVGHDTLCRVAELDEEEVVRAVDELRRHRLVDERLEMGAVIYDFTHPLVREALYAELGLARTRLLHGRVAEALEETFGDAAIDHAGELAYHYTRAPGRELAPKAVRYLSAAGRAALEKYSNREAADYLNAAIERVGEAVPGESVLVLKEDLARARQRLGDFAEAVRLWEEVLRSASGSGDPRCMARTHRRLGLIDYLRGRHAEALDHFERGLGAAREATDGALEARLHLGRGDCLMELGRPAEARAEIEAALGLARKEGESALLARVHVALLLLHTWIGPPERAHAHGAEALALAHALQNAGLSCTIHWGMVVLAGLTGDADATARHLAECESLAEDLRSPLHQLRVAEPAVEFLANTGEWGAAIERGEQAIATARALNQRSVLSRLLVWTGLIYFARGEVARGERNVEEAWELSGADRENSPLDVHTVVPAHVGRAAHLVATGDYAGAIRVAEAGLAIADGTGYTVWAIHRLLPILAEAHLWMGDVEGATRVGKRLREDSLRLGHRLGLAWADACDALVVWLKGDIPSGMVRLREAAERLEAIPALPDAARVRRHFAARLRDVGEREEALRQLRHVHDVFLRLGAEPELAKTREQIRELGARPPTKEVAGGAHGLSGREAEVARLAAGGRTNKTIARKLGISPRTVSTHLSNIFTKLELTSRRELSEYLRRSSARD
jgi:DNA-binding CsgD family transcriptional regulator